MIMSPLFFKSKPKISILGGNDNTNNDILPDSTVKDEPIAKENEAECPETIREGGVSVTLLDNKLWTDFHKLGTEMIITKAGR